MLFKIEKVLERDMDLLVINNFINNKLTKLFLDKLNYKNYKVISVEHSYVDADLGESDITVIIEKENHKVGLLIEDKIDAPAMDLQPERYIERGKRGISNNRYNEFKTIIIAPKQYLNTNPYVEKYQYQISYEEILKVLSNDIYAKTLINKAIEEKESGYVIIENEMVTKFWEKYYEFIRLYYPTIKIHEIHGPRGSSASWPELLTDFKQVKIMHKSDRGYMDLTFNKMANYIDIFNKYIKELSNDLKIVKTGKSLSIRLNVPIIDFKNEFNNYTNEMHECMKAALKLYDILSKINVLMMYNEIEK
ncbi:MAG: hypothetical protein VZS44_05625 [Bacilli bacterium]|nr:hypothetical protein [Bacilli bacterium]